MTATNCTVVITAHMDDECLSAGGLIQDRLQRGHKVALMNVFGRAYNYGDGDQHVDEQVSAWRSSCAALGLHRSNCLNHGLTEGEPTSHSYYKVLRHIEQFLHKHSPTEVVIHDDQDRNQDHLWLSSLCKIALRPWACPDVLRILMMQSPDGLPKTVNHYVRVSEESFYRQLSALEYYSRELRAPPHPRSSTNLDAWLKVWGGNSHSDRAEPYRLFFSKD